MLGIASGEKAMARHWLFRPSGLLGNSQDRQGTMLPGELPIRRERDASLHPREVTAEEPRRPLLAEEPRVGVLASPRGAVVLNYDSHQLKALG